MSRPEDISQEAWLSAGDVIAGSSAHDADLQVSIARAIMAATLAEREACAAQLERAAKASARGHKSIVRGRSTFNWLTHAASLLRKRGEA